MKKKILLVSLDNPMDKRTWSGIEYSVYQQLIKYYDVEVFVVKAKWALYIDKLRMRFMTLGRQHTSFGLFHSYVCSKKVQRKLQAGKYDAAFVFGCMSAFLNTNTPIIYYADAVTHLMQNYYWNFSHLLAMEADYIQGRCLRHNDVNLAASTWALNGMVDYSGVSEEKCKLCPFGANVQVDDMAIDKSKESKDSIDILFVGVDWERKGGEIAIDTLVNLRKIAPKKLFKLHVVGDRPPKAITDDDIVFYGFLDRNEPEQEALHTKLFVESDIFLLPTKAECAGIVFCEASAYGLPIVTYDTGGIADYVVNNVNGYRLAEGSSGKAFAETILKILDTPSLKGSLSRGGRKLYRESLNWDVCGEIIHQVISHEIDKKRL